MSEIQHSQRALAIAHMALSGLYEARTEIIQRANADNEWHTSIGLLYRTMPNNVVPEYLLQLQARAEEQGIPLEYEILRIIGYVPPHYHARAGGCVVKCDGGFSEALLDPFGRYPKCPWFEVRVGEIVLAPAGVVHAIRAPENSLPFHMFSVHCPAIEKEDVVYVD